MYPEFDIKSKYITIHPCDLLPSYLSTIQDRARARRESPNEKTVRFRTKKGEIQTIRQQEYPNFFDFFFLPFLGCFHLLCGSPIFISHGLTDYPLIFFPLSLLWCWTSSFRVPENAFFFPAPLRCCLEEENICFHYQWQ